VSSEKMSISRAVGLDFGETAARRFFLLSKSANAAYWRKADELDRPLKGPRLKADIAVKRYLATRRRHRDAHVKSSVRVSVPNTLSEVSVSTSKG